MITLDNFSKEELLEKLEVIKSILDDLPPTFETRTSLSFINELTVELVDMDDI